jgi:hypothetical protein
LTEDNFLGRRTLFLLQRCEVSKAYKLSYITFLGLRDVSSAFLLSPELVSFRAAASDVFVLESGAFEEDAVGVETGFSTAWGVWYDATIVAAETVGTEVSFGKG